METEFLNCPKTLYQQGLAKLKKQPRPAFEDYLYTQDVLVEKLVKKYKKFKKFIIVANGGSRTGLYFLYNAYKFELDKEAVFISAPNVLEFKEIAKRFKKKDTCVVVISKSGTNVVPHEIMLYFMKKNYTILPITGESGPLREIALKKKYDMIVHPAVGGRFSFFTSCAMFLSQVWGLDVKKMLRVAQVSFKKYGYTNLKATNDALIVAMALYELEKKGYTQVCNGIYDSHIAFSLPLIVQLMHESVSKNGKTGQTFFGDEGPELQHHTMQRVYGGRKNIALMLTRVESKKSDTLEVPSMLQSIPLREGTLGVMDGLHVATALDYEIMGNMQQCKTSKIPCILLTLKDNSLSSLAEYVVFWFYVAIYSAHLRGVDPFNQPHVEYSKQNTFDLLMKR